MVLFLSSQGKTRDNGIRVDVLGGPVLASSPSAPPNISTAISAGVDLLSSQHCINGDCRDLDLDGDLFQLRPPDPEPPWRDFIKLDSNDDGQISSEITAIFDSRPDLFNDAKIVIHDAIVCFRAAGYSILALAMRIKSPELMGLQNMTVFALEFPYIFAGGDAYVTEVRFHVVPNQLLMHADLARLAEGTVLPMPVRGQYLVVTRSALSGPFGSGLRINYVPIKNPDVVFNSKIIVHSLFFPLPHLYLVDRAMEESSAAAPASVTVNLDQDPDVHDGEVLEDNLEVLGQTVMIEDGTLSSEGIEGDKDPRHLDLLPLFIAGDSSSIAGDGITTDDLLDLENDHDRGEIMRSGGSLALVYKLFDEIPHSMPVFEVDFEGDSSPSCWYSKFLEMTAIFQRNLEANANARYLDQDPEIAPLLLRLSSIKQPWSPPSIFILHSLRNSYA